MKRQRKKRAGYVSNYVAPRRRHRGSGFKSGLSKVPEFLSLVFSALVGGLAWPFLAAGRLFKPRRRGVRIGVTQTMPPLASASVEKPSGMPARAGARAGRAWMAAWCILFAGAVLGGLFLGWAILFSDSSVEVVVDENGLRRTLQTKTQTVGELFSSNGITVNEEEDYVNYSDSSVLQAGMEIIIRRAFPIAVASKGEVTVLRMREGTVGDALDRAGIHYDAADELSSLSYADVEPGMHIQHTDVETEYETVEQVIEYKEQIIKDSSRYMDYNKIQTNGEEGTKRLVRRLVYKDGELVLREIMNQIILKEAVDEVRIEGTKIRYQTSLSGDKRVWKPKPTDGEIKSAMVVSEITAYTHTGNRTATGRRTRIGYVAVNPEVIPYGTRMYIPGYGYCSAQDTGAFRHEEGGQKNQIDIFMNTEKECRAWGRKRNVTIYILK